MAIKNRTQFFNSATEHWQKRNTKNGQIIDVKEDGKPYKNIKKERSK